MSIATLHELVCSATGMEVATSALDYLQKTLTHTQWITVNGGNIKGVPAFFSGLYLHLPGRAGTADDLARLSSADTEP